MRGIHRQHGDSISVLLFFQNKESKLTKENTNTIYTRCFVEMRYGITEFKVRWYVRTSSRLVQFDASVRLPT
jgi:hypothetical protein